MAASMPSWKYFNVTWPAQYVAHVEINRPEKLNSFHEAMWVEFGQVFFFLSADSNTRAIILTGAGPRAFTAGLDVVASNITEIPGPKDPARTGLTVRSKILSFQNDISMAEKCPKPVIAIMHGYAFGLAIDMSTCCDVRLCTSDTRFAVKEVDIGLAADIGTLSRLPKVVGNASWCKDVCLTARTFGAEEASRVGFVSGIYDGKEEAIKKGLELAKLMAEKSPVAVQGTKDVLNFSRDHSVDDGLKYVAVYNAFAVQTEDVPNAIKANLKKEKGRFAKL